jgi:hexulose-6-phosphate isomerase
MQGRLVPRYLGRYQAFPFGYWQAEFNIAKELGLTHIEFILDHDKAERNPLMTAAGIEEIKETIAATGVTVRSICADYFMVAPLHKADHKDKSREVLHTLLENSAQVGVKDVVIPCVDASSLKSDEDKKALIAALTEAAPLAVKKEIRLNLETDLGPQDFKSLMTQMPDCVRVNYDIGNSASLGFNVLEEFEAYGQWVSDVHIKDRVLGGFSCLLGTGNAKFDDAFAMLKKYGCANIVMQASRAEPYLDDLVQVKKQLEFTQGFMKKYFA